MYNFYLVYDNDSLCTPKHINLIKPLSKKRYMSIKIKIKRYIR